MRERLDYWTMKSLWKDVKVLEEKFGVQAWNDVTRIIYKMQDQIDRVRKSRDEWRKKYEDLLKNGKN